MAKPVLRDPRKEAARWWKLFVISAIVSIAVFAANAILSEVRPDNAWGLSYGIAATVLMGGVIAFGIRRRTMSLSSKLRLGRSRTWLYFHIYAGTLFMILVLMHSGFRLPVGFVTTWLFWLSVVTVVSGFFGLALQKWIPRVLSSGLSIEVNYERIPELVEEIRSRAAKAAEASKEPLIESLYSEKIAPALQSPQRRWSYVFDITGGIQSRLTELSTLRPLLPEADRATLAQLESLYRTKLEIDAHYTLQSLLRYWLYSHVPVSLVMTVFLILHLISVYAW